MNKNKNQLQQGDVIIRKISKIPDDVKNQTRIALQKGKCILARGEHTGHAHIIEDTDAELIQIGERILLSLLNPAVLKHEEHAPITLEPGLYEVGQVREYDYFQKMQRIVQD